MYDELWTAFYKNIEMIDQINRMIYFIRTQNYDRGLRISGSIMKNFQETLPYLAACQEFYNEDKLRMDIEQVMGMLNSLLDAQESRDYVLLADLYELTILPFLMELQEKMVVEEQGVPVYNRYRYKDNYMAIKNLEQKKPMMEGASSLARALSDEGKLPQWLLQEGGYQVEYTSSGEITMKVQKGEQQFYLHSNVGPSKEAFYLANSWLTPGKEEYVIYGLGLGYHIKQLHLLDPDARITVYESDIDTIQMVTAFAYLRELLAYDEINLIYDPTLTAFSKKISETEVEQEVLIYQPSLYTVKNEQLKEFLENYFVQYSSMKNQLVRLYGNFRSNIKRYSELVDVLRPKFEGKRLYIVAAGPSLDLNFEQLRSVSGKDSIILATETVFHKLMKANIRPDYVLATDANPRVIGHISGLEESGVPFLFLSTAFKGFARRYQGKKYMLLQKDFSPAQELAKELGATLFETGGSVSTTALDLGIRFGCRQIVFLGLDLSYPGDFAHAEGTSIRKIADVSKLREVEDIYGGRVKTNKSMDIFRKWIEKRIERAKQEKEYLGEFIDATEGGARILGMKIATMKEMVEDEGNCPR